ncbi:putative synaptic vesicle protein [Operophtera brumata]|uniref:Putative synaptic vesicle protein n=1 Tax=Operophtera brumata TaxID=104452 RepID=A0A0L7L347_OPEBR|nr:putative synaptic vesicle protein [Operophtera brumata]
MPILSGLAFLWLPESPKFMMSRGRNKEAMVIFKRIYALNTGRPADEFPVKALVEEKTEQQGRGVAALRGGGAQLKPLFRPPHVKWLFMICIIHLGCMFGSNTIRLWYPQLAAMIGSSQTLCAAIAPTLAPEVEVACVPIETDMLTYLQSAAVGAGSVLTYGIGGAIVNRCGKKLVCGICGMASAVIIVLLPFFGNTSSSVVIMVTTALAFTSLCGASLSSIAVDLFPTSLSYESIRLVVSWWKVMWLIRKYHSVIHSWNLFLLTTALMPILSGLAFLWLPESPKFMMSRGRNKEAMVIFKRIYALNTGRPADEFPVKALVEEKTEQQGRGVAALRGGGAQLKPLFRPPHVKWLFMICIIHLGCMFGSNTIRLWYPQLAAMIGSSQTLCAAIAPTSAPEVEVACVPIETDMLTYLQSAAVGAGSVLTYGIGGAIVNRCGKKLVCGICGMASAVIIVLLPFFGNTSSSVVIMVTTALAFTSLCGASLSSIAVDLFPTSLR